MLGPVFNLKDEEDLAKELFFRNHGTSLNRKTFINNILHSTRTIDGKVATFMIDSNYENAVCEDVIQNSKLETNQYLNPYKLCCLDKVT